MPNSRYLTKGYSQADNRVRGKKKRKKKGQSQENQESNIHHKKGKSFKSLNNKIKANKNISVWQHRPRKQSKLQLNVSRLINRPNQIPSSLYSRRYQNEESILAKLQKQIKSSKHGDRIFKFHPFGMLNLAGKSTPKGQMNISTRRGKKPKSLTQIVVDYPVKPSKKSILGGQMGLSR